MEAVPRLGQDDNNLDCHNDGRIFYSRDFVEPL